jgi:hypothetical protein
MLNAQGTMINEESYKPYYSIRDVSQVIFVEDEDKTCTSY